MDPDKEGTADEVICEDVVRLALSYEEKSDPPGRSETTERPRDKLVAARIEPPHASGEAARLAPRTRARIMRHVPGRRGRMINAALGSAIFATMSVAAMVVLEAPYSYIFASGAAALAAITLAREARENG